MRGAGCTINDMWDRKLDKAVGEDDPTSCRQKSYVAQEKADRIPLCFYVYSQSEQRPGRWPTVISRPRKRLRFSACSCRLVWVYFSS